MNNFAKIIEIQRGDIKFAYVQNDEINYLDLFDQFLAEEGHHELLDPSDKLERYTYLINHNKSQFIFKIDGGVEHRLERRLIAKITGDFYFNLIRKLAKISLDKCDIAYELYLVAFDQKTKRHYMIFNFIEGRSLKWEEMKEYGEQIKNCIEKLHSYNLVSNDVHGGNFILTPDGKIKAIDLTNSGFIWLTKANDAIELKERFNIKIKVPFFAMAIKKFTHGFKRLSRKIRGKED
ncbi:lipopolysaccharide core heptose(II) kinase RfaY [Gilliamella sp. App6-5]|uniref:lipopolysaccharide core heptose(II) kinase RfaY n=1 Tax=Gilliamella sp. App6-5 TaxID=3120232 RepID=UPI00159EC8A1|nr:lipopolysaccharide core heptose(II) kinase RfaY [Gilliamella apicola]